LFFFYYFCGLKAKQGLARQLEEERKHGLGIRVFYFPVANERLSLLPTSPQLVTERG
jgi:hypothetical protein